MKLIFYKGKYYTNEDINKYLDILALAYENNQLSEEIINEQETIIKKLETKLYANGQLIAMLSGVIVAGIIYVIFNIANS